MARSSRYLAPLSSASLLNRCPGCLRLGYHPSRPFSSASSRQATMVTPAAKEIKMGLENRRSRKVEMKRMPASKIPTDVGLLPQTFIRPANRHMPRLFSATWKQRLRLEILWVRTRFQNFASLIYFIYWPQRKLPKASRTNLDLQSRPRIALHLHSTFYTLLASGNTKPINELLLDGLAEKTHSQITQRAETDSPPQTWQIVRYTSPLRLPFSTRLLPWPLTSLLPFSQAKIVSDRVVPLPDIGPRGGTVIRQCIVRIRSLQSLDKHDGAPPAQADLTEYIVMQQMNSDGLVPTWKLWGTTRPTTQAEMEGLLSSGGERGGAKEHNITLMDRMRATMASRGS